MRIIFLGTPEYATLPLRALAADPRYQLVGVVTQPDRPTGRGRIAEAPPVKRAALALGVPVLQPITLRDADAVEQLAAWRPDAGVVAAYGEILRRNVLAIPPLGYLNIHPSLLPRYRGPTPVPAAILNGDSETGVTVMQLDSKMDSGPIFAQQRVPLNPDTRTWPLTHALFELGSHMLCDVLARYADGSLMPTPQDDAQATYCKMLQKQDGFIDWNTPAVQIERMTRAYDPWPGAQTTWQSQPFKIIAARPNLSWRGAELPGSLLLQPGNIAVATGSGALELLTVQPAGKRPLPAADWRNGLHRMSELRFGA